MLMMRMGSISFLRRIWHSGSVWLLMSATLRLRRLAPNGLAHYGGKKMEDKKKDFIKNSSLFAAEYICCGFSGKAEALWLKLKPQYLAGIKDLVENDPPKVDRALVYFGRDILDMLRRTPHSLSKGEADCLHTVERFFESTGHDDWYDEDGGMFETFADDTNEYADIPFGGAMTKKGGDQE